MIKLESQKFIMLGGKEKMDKIKRCLQCGRLIMISKTSMLWRK